MHPTSIKMPNFGQGVYLAILAVGLAQQAFAQQEPSLADALTDLKRLHGEAYVAARKEFLRNPEAGDFLASQCEKETADWLAYVLLQRRSNRNFTDLFDAALSDGRAHDLFVGEKAAIGSGTFEWNAFDKFQIYLPAVTDLAIRKRFQPDPLWEVAILLELFVMRTHEFSDNLRFWNLFDYAQGWPFDKASHAEWERMNDPRNWANVKNFNYERLGQWLSGLLRQAHDPVIVLSLAARYPGPESAKAISNLADQDGMTGALAALLYSGRVSRTRMVGHPFNGPWLEAWVKKASPAQLQAVSFIFSEKERPKSSLRNGSVAPDNSTLDVPEMVLGLFARQRPNEAPKFFGERFRERLQRDIETLCLSASKYAPGDPVHDLSYAERGVRSSILWMPGVEQQLNAVTTPYPEARRLLDQALANVRKNKDRTSPYPTGDELQAILGTPKPKD